jgi:hypothetical protein
MVLTDISEERKTEIATKLRTYIDEGMEPDVAGELLAVEYSLSDDDVAQLLTEIDTGLA